MQLATNCLRSASVCDAAENHLDQVQPPSEMKFFRLGNFFFSAFSSRKLPASLSLHRMVSVGSTRREAVRP